jgi:hypothetical protein
MALVLSGFALFLLFLIGLELDGIHETLKKIANKK